LYRDGKYTVVLDEVFATDGIEVIHNRRRPPANP
jgi:hypothetical protein